MKYIYESSENQKKHWLRCEKNKDPYIVISDYNERYKQIFYDISNYKIDLDEVSQSVQTIYKSYIDFFLISYSDVESLFDQYYFFNILVKSEHAEFIADALFDFLKNKLSS